MLVSGNDLLAIANENNFAVPAFNVSDYAMANALFKTCEELESPWMLAIHPDEMSHIGGPVIFAFRELAHESRVPVAIHWDHGASYEEMIHAINLGFTSVMIDKSLLPFEDNVRVTREAVRAAHAVGVSVEAELGTIGKTDGFEQAGADDIIYTVPEDAVRFVAETGVDSLAVAIGTRHGLYPAELPPRLKLDLLEEIKGSVRIPLVLHGGSNNPDDEVREACTLGINKVNISSDIKAAYYQRMREVLEDSTLREPNVIEPPCMEALSEVAAHKIDLFGSAHRADLY